MSLIFPLTLLLVAGFNVGGQSNVPTANLVGSQPQEVLQTFETWANQYAGGPDLRPKAPLNEQGLALAKARRAALLQLIRTDPKRAIDAALLPPLRAGLPVEITRELEASITGTGNLSVVGVLAKPGGAAVEPIQRFVTINGKTYRAYTHGTLLAQTTKTNLALRGIAIDGSLAFEEQGGIKIPLGTSTPVTVNRRVLIIRVDFSDLPGDPANGTYTAPYVQDVMATQIAPFIQQSSYGKAALLYTVTPRLYRLPQTAIFYATRSMGYELIADAQVAVDSDFPIANYDSIAVLFSSLENLPGSQITYGGASELGGRNIWINGEFDFRVMAHELGHNFGLWHANLWQVQDGNPISSGGVSVQYQDCFDVMGSNLANDTRVDYNPWFKNQLGWIPNDRVQIITSSGKYRVHRFDSSAASGTLALKIVKDNTRNYWLSYRGNFTDNASLQNGAYIIWGYNVSQGSDLLDMTTPGVGVKDAALQIGATFSDPNTHLTIAPLAKGGVPLEEYLDIDIDFGPAFPVISLGPQDLLVTPGQTAVFSVQAAGNPIPSIQWQWKPANGTDWSNLLDGEQYQGSVKPTLSILNTTLAMNADQFRCVLSNSSGSLTSRPPVFLSVIQSGFTTFAGSAKVRDSIDGIGTLARFGGPSGVTVDGGGNVFVADSVNSNIRKITSEGLVSTVAGFAGSTGSADGALSSALFCEPSGVAVDNQGNLYITDAENHTVRKISRSGLVSTFAGAAGISGSTDGRGSDARFCFPLGIAIDRAGNLYVSCQGTSTIRKITPQADVSTLAGLAGTPGSADGIASSARFLCPNGIAVDADSNIYVADQNNSTIRKILPNGTVVTLAGLAGTTGFSDGAGNRARFNYPGGVAVDKAGNVYVADTYNSTIRKISPGGLVTTFAGLASQVGVAEGISTTARFNTPNGVAVDLAGNVYVADTGNSTVRKYAPAQLEPPQVRAFSSTGSVVLSWSSLWRGYILESQPQFLPGPAWIPVSQPPMNTDGMLFLTNDACAESSAFRLRSN